MATNIFANIPIAVTALQSIPFTSVGLDESKIFVIHRIGTPPASFIPSRGINPITGFVQGQGYVIYSKIDLDLTAFVAPPIPSEVQEIENWVLANFSQFNHHHTVSDVTGLQTILDGKLSVPANPIEGKVLKYVSGAIQWADDMTSSGGSGGSTDWVNITGKPSTFTPSAHTHAISEVTGLQTALNAKAALSHSHSISDVSGLQTALDAKQVAGSYANAVHTHSASDIQSGVLNVARLGTGTANSTKVLYGDGTWKDAPSGGTDAPATLTSSEFSI